MESPHCIRHFTLHEDHGWSHQIQELQSLHLGKPAQWHHGASGILLVDVTRLPSSPHFHAVYTNRNNGSGHKEPHKTSQILPVERDQNPQKTSSKEASSWVVARRDSSWIL